MTRPGTPQALRWPQRRRRLFVLALLAGFAVLAWFWGPLTAQTRAGAAYGARIGCSCRFVAGRPLDQCSDDFIPGMSMVILSEDDEAKSITARVFPIASETVSYRKGQGCVFAPAD